MIAKGALGEGATGWAQGGIAAVLERGDSFESACQRYDDRRRWAQRPKVVEHVVEAAPRAIAHLIELGVPFAIERRRAAPDARGRAQPSAHRPCRRRHRLCDPAGARSRRREAPQHHPRARHGRDRPRHRPPREPISRPAARCTACTRYNRKTKRVETLTARATILASGGAGRAYLYSTAPRGATGDGIAMAWRAGCRVSNMEFMQFHPTCLYNLEVKNFLITEAVRGEGGQLKLRRSEGRRQALHAAISTSAPSSRRATWSPARSTMRSSGSASTTSTSTSRHRDPDFVEAHFPNIYDKLLGPRDRHHRGADPGRARRSIIPAAA